MKKTNTVSLFALVKIQGEDASDFLQGQLSCDVNLLDQNWQIAAFCNPKGRTIMLLRIWRYQQDFYALIEPEVAEVALKRLAMYVMRSKVSIEICQAAELLAYQTDPVSKPEQMNMSFSNNAQNLLYKDHLLAVYPNGIDASSDSLDPSKLISNGEFKTRQIENGFPILDKHGMEQFIPQMLNLDLVGGISFKKGCYTGQEIIARMHYRGNLKQRLFLLTSEEPIDIDFEQDLENRRISTVLEENAENGLSNAKSNAGTIVSISSDGLSCLAVMRIDQLNEGAKYHLENGQSVLLSSSHQALPELVDLIGQSGRS